MSRNILGIFDGGDIEEVSALIDKLEESSFDYLRLEGDGMSIVIGKNGADEAVQASVATVAAAPSPAGQGGALSAIDSVDAPGVSAEDPASAAGAEAEQRKPDVAEQEGIFVIRAPSQGLFFAQPEPGAKSYVTVGADVKAGDTVGLVEIMKTYSAITSPVDGEVIAIHVKNEDLLEPDQPLVSIKVK